MPDLYCELNRLCESELYPFHMPGHKRNCESTPLKGAFNVDITEIEEFDNLHDEKGIILEAEERANRLYGADKTFFLVNGSTCGVLSAVSAAVPEGGRILAGRGSHKSFYNAAYLRRLDISYLPVKMIDKYGIYDGYTGDDVKEALDKSESLPSAVFITSPTYEGKCSDISKIADLCHKKKIPLIVDAAHGAHFGFGEGIPESAVKAGADLVIHSVHKTLPSMTQTALLHVQGSLIDKKKLKRFLTIYQSSSPSYVLMASIDLCMKEMEERGGEFVSKLLKYRKTLEEETKELANIRVAGLSELPDPAKALIYLPSEAMTGQQLYDILREEYKLQLEMAGEKYALAIISGWDTEEGIRRLIDAIRHIDEDLSVHTEITKKKTAANPNSTDREDTPHNTAINVADSSTGVSKESKYRFTLPACKAKICDAWDEEKVIVPLKNANGQISAEFIGLYPPGIPLIVPGEVFDERIVSKMIQYLDEGMNLQGIVCVGNDENKGIIDTDRRGVICVKQR